MSTFELNFSAHRAQISALICRLHVNQTFHQCCKGSFGKRVSLDLMKGVSALTIEIPLIVCWNFVTLWTWQWSLKLHPFHERPILIWQAAYILLTAYLPFHGRAKAMAREDNKMEEKTKTVMQIAWIVSKMMIDMHNEYVKMKMSREMK